MFEDPRVAPALYVIIGLPGCVGNVLILLVGITTKNMREKEYHYPYLLALCDLISTLGTFMAGVHRLYNLHNDHWGLKATASDCISTPYIHLLFLALILIPSVHLAICVDRLICIQKPFYYYQLTDRYTKRVSSVILVTCVGYWLLLIVSAMVQPDFFDMKFNVHCSPSHFAKIVPTLFISAHIYDAVGHGIVVVLVVVMILSLLCKAKEDENTRPEGIMEQVRKRNERVTKMLLYNLVFSIFCSCIPSMGMTYMILTKNFNLVSLTVFNMLNTLNCVNNILFYLWKNKDMRVAVLNLVGRKSASVVPTI